MKILQRNINIHRKPNVKEHYSTKRNARVKHIALILTTVLILTTLNIQPVSASVIVNAENITVADTAGQSYNVRSLLVTTAGERFISLSDMSVVLKNTSKAFTVSFSGYDVNISLGSATDRNDTGAYSAEDTIESRRINATSGKISINGIESAYAGIMDDLSGSKEIFLRLSDFVMITDTNMYFDEIWHIDADSGFRVSTDTLISDGFFDGIDAALTGDATTGEIFFEYDGYVAVEIASTTKLISYAVIMDAIENGEIHEDDMVTISAEASRISKSEDGVVEYEPGDVIPVRELLIAMLLPSSNESAYAMAEHVCGSEAAFVERMNSLLESIGVTDAEIFNCHGLPKYKDDAYASKNQNRMSAEDMFRVVCYIFENYPQITDITSMKTAELTNAHASVKNTNGLLKNMPEVNGLKTGTTNKAGACLIATCTAVNDAGEEHILTSIVFGAESNTARISYSEVLIRLAKQQYKEGVSQDGSSVITYNETPDAKKILSEVIKNARKQGIIE